MLRCQDCFRIFRWRTAVAISLVIIGAVPAAPRLAAQTSLPDSGSRVRVTAPDYDLRRATGQVMRLTTDSITIDRDGRPAAVTIPIDGLSRLEVSTVKRPGLGFVKAAGAGFAIGTLAGLAFGALQYATCSKDECVLWFLITVPIGAGAGLVVGSIVGLARAADRWEEVPLTRRSGESGMAGQHRTAKIGFSIAF